MDDRELLQQYVETQSEAAFSELARRHLNLVFGTALRVVRDSATAQDVAQAVFIKLARKAWTLRDGNALPAWLYRAAYHEACNAVRGESRRRLNEAEAMKFSDDEIPTASAWEKLGPLVDEAMQRLSRVEQNAVVLRYFEGKSLQEAGMALGTTEAAARMRVNRAVEKIRRHFARGGVTIASGALVAAMSTHACRAAPAALAANVAHTSIVSAGTGGLAHTFWRIFAMSTQSKVAITAAIVALAAAIPLGVQQQEIIQLQTDQTQTATHANAATATKIITRTTPTLSSYEAELKRILGLQGGIDLTRSLLEFASHLDAKTAQALIADLAKLPPTDKNKVALSALVDRLVRLNPKDALDWANAISTTHGRELTLGILFDTWSNIDPAKALAAAAAFDKPALREALMGAVLKNMVRSDPQDVLSALQHLPGNRTAQQIYTEVFNTWGSSDPADAATAVMNLPATNNRNIAIQGLISGWATVDPQAALNWSNNLTAGDARTEAINASLKVLAQQDPQAAATYAASATNTNTRNQLVQEVVSQWGQDDPQAALAWVKQTLTGAPLDDTFARSLAGPLTQVNPQAAADYLANMPQGGGRRMIALMTIASTWAEQDPQGDLAWLQSIPNANRVPMMADAVSNWANSDPAAATAYVQSISPTDPAFDKMMAALAENQASVDPKNALAWAQSLPADGGRDAATTAVLGKLSIQDPVTAAATVINMPTGTAQTTAVQSIAVNWASQDPAAAAQWVFSLPSGDLHDTAATHFNSVVQQTDPATAFNIALTISNATTQSNQLNRVLGLWLQTDPAAASAAVQSANVPDATQTRLQNTLQKGPTATNATPAAPAATNN